MHRRPDNLDRRRAQIEQRFDVFERGPMNQGRARRGGQPDPGHPRRQREVRGRMTPDERDELVSSVGARLERELAALSQTLNTRLDRLDGRVAAAERLLAGVAREVAAIRRAVGVPTVPGRPPGGRPGAAQGGSG